jgi:putative ABC transport system permease protein
MGFTQKIRSAARNLFHREKVERDLDAEVRSYSDLLQEEKMANGMNSTDANREARMNMGGPEQLKEEIRGARAGAWIETLWQDLRFGARMLHKNPGFTAIAVLTLALGIGANTAIFSVVDTIVIRPLPYRDPERLLFIADVRFSDKNPSLVDSDRRYPELFSSIASIRQAPTIMTGVTEPQELRAASVSSGFFDLLGWYPAFGRAFLPDDEKPGAPGVAVVSDAFWRRTFGTDPSAVGRVVQLDGKPTTIVGVMPAGFQNPSLNKNMDVWLPGTVGDRTNWIARLNDGVTRESADAVLQTTERTLQGRRKDSRVHILPLHELLSYDLQPDLLILLGCAAFVLLVACTNVANLLLARGAARRLEITVRSALGASRVRVTRQLLTESILLAVIGGAAGLAFAYGTLKILLAAAPTYLSRMDTVHLDARVLYFATIVSVFTALLFGVLPAIRLAKVDLANSMKESAGVGTGRRQSRILGSLVGIQVGIALLLMLGATLMVRSFLRIQPAHPGFDTSNKITTMLPPLPWKNRTPVLREQFVEQTLENIRAIPGVKDAAAIDYLPLTGMSRSADAFVKIGGPGIFANIHSVSPNYFDLMGIPIVGGRSFTERDDPRVANVAIVSRHMAERFWPGENPIGKQFTTKLIDGEVTVVGLAADVRALGTRLIPWSDYYVPVRQQPPVTVTLVVSTGSDPMRFAPAIRSAILSVDKDQPLTEVQTVKEIISSSVSLQRFETLLIVSFAAIALILAAAGIYGVISYSVTQRSREMGIRIALGASHSQVIRAALSATVIPISLGLIAGWAASLGLTRFMSSVLYGLSPTDVAANIAAIALLSIVAASASYVPARRALKIDPAQVLRYE